MGWFAVCCVLALLCEDSDLIQMWDSFDSRLGSVLHRRHETVGIPDNNAATILLGSSIVVEQQNMGVSTPA
jgi:hypothetical protein